jgi:hypothetical protein
MFGHLLNHEMFHAYRIEELLLKKGLGISRSYSKSHLSRTEKQQAAKNNDEM